MKHTDNLSHTLQDCSRSAAQGQRLAKDVCKTLSRDRSEVEFDLFWTRLLKRKSEVDAVSEPQLPRKRRAPARKEEGDSGTHYFPSTPKEHFRHMYYSAIDATIECIRTRFNQNDFKVYQSIQELLLKVVAGKDHEEELAKVMAVYGDTKLQQYKLETQLSQLSVFQTWCSQWGTTLPDSTLLTCLTFFSHSEMLANSYLVRFAYLVNLCLSCQQPTPSVSAPSPP